MLRFTGRILRLRYGRGLASILFLPPDGRTLQMTCCPTCGVDPAGLADELRRLLAIVERANLVQICTKSQAAEQWLAPCQLAEFGVSESQARRIVKRGIMAGEPGCRSDGGRLFATRDGFERARAMRV